MLVVTDPGIRAVGHVDRAMKALGDSHLEYYVFDQVSENPGEEDVAAGAELARRHEVDFLVGLGGGSAMDCAKGVNFVYTNGGRMEDYWGRDKATQPMLPAIGLPCTAGTGSEAQSFALISREGDHRKMACGDAKARFRTVILDAELASTAPSEVAAATGLDAISHALESLVTKARNPFSSMLSREAWRHLEPCFTPIVAGEADQAAWGQMLLGAHFAGAAIESSMLGAAHATANPLTAAYRISHGIAVALMLPATIRFNAPIAEGIYRQVVKGVARDSLDSRRVGEPIASASHRDPMPTSQPAAGRARSQLNDQEWPASEALATRVEALRSLAGQPQCLRDAGVEESALEVLAEQAAEQWTARYNPREVGVSEALELYRAAF